MFFSKDTLGGLYQSFRFDKASSATADGPPDPGSESSSNSSTDGVGTVAAASEPQVADAPVTKVASGMSWKSHPEEDEEEKEKRELDAWGDGKGEEEDTSLVYRNEKEERAPSIGWNSIKVLKERSVAIVVLIGVSSIAAANGQTIPHKKVFVTSAKYNGNLGGISGANDKCNNLATAAGLPGTYKAWLSKYNGFNPKNHFDHSNPDDPYYRVDGTTKVADNWQDLTDGALKAAITMNEKGAILPNNVDDRTVWTGTDTAGSPNFINANTNANCGGWTKQSILLKSYVGLAGRTDSQWTETGTTKQCGGSWRLYCFQQNIPTQIPTRVPSRKPTHMPTQIPTREPSHKPTQEPTNIPTQEPSREPSRGPTMLPTSQPTQKPTAFPSGEPSKHPTPAESQLASTTSTPWDIIPYNTTVDFSEDSGEKENLVTEYKIGEGRAYDHKLQAGSCDAPKDANLTTNAGHTVEASTSSTGPVADGYEMLTLKHGFSKGMIADSSIWKEGEDMIELCETVQLTLPDGDNGLMVVSELKSNVTITFDLSQNFQVDPGITLEEATIQANNETSSLSDYIDAYMCGSFGEKLTVNELTLKQNTPLSICIESNSEDVLVDEVTSMVIKGKKPNTNSAEDSSLTVIQDNSQPTYSAITSITGVDTKKVTISTFIPPDRFDYSATDAKIDVSGSLLLKFAESPERKLEVDLSNRMLQVDGVAKEEEAVEFDVIINIAPEEAGGLDKAMMSSALGLAGNIFAMIGLAVGATYALW